MIYDIILNKILIEINYNEYQYFFLSWECLLALKYSTDCVLTTSDHGCIAS